jgi:EAL domain-containing protein (putative c-di-GMP-specific phosphodiesterase class I)
MRESIKSDNFFIEYQPLVGSQDSQTLSYEALVRWTHPSLGILYPNDFIDLAEESGLIIKLGHWIIDRVFKDVKIMNDKSRAFNVSINISAKQLNDTNFFRYVNQKIDEYQIDTKFIEFEITESILLENNDYVRKNIMNLRGLGIRFSLDDFGTGYSSMNYIKNFPIDTIKIDRSFVDTMLKDKSNMAIVDSILYLSKQLGKSVIAEGIETIEQMQHFREKECDILQGFYFSKPKKLDDL